MTDRAELTGLTALRLFAALFVLLFHSRYFAVGGWFEVPVFAISSSGWLGVDIFFVLSGFVISYVYDNEFNFKQYLLRRFARIYPLYLVTTIAALVAIILLGRPSYAMFDNVDVLINFLMIQSWFSDWRISVNFVSWTVSAEWTIYLVFPILAFVSRALPVSWLGILFPITVYTLFGGLAWAGLPGDINKCLFLFCSGIMLFRYWRKFGGFGEWVKPVAIISALAMISMETWFSYFGLSLKTEYLSLFAIPIVAWGVTWKTDRPLLLIGGRVSYSIYLVHGVVYLVLRRCIENGLLDQTWGLFLFWFFTLSFAFAIYHWVERPSRRLIVKNFS